MSAQAAAQPAVEGWFTTGPEPRLIGRRCGRCGTVSFPPTRAWCPNPGCWGDQLEPVELSRRARVWSYTDARYQPPAPYITQTEPYEPFAIVAAELDEEHMVVLGQAAAGVGLEDLKVGTPVELVVEPLYTIDGVEHLIWRWAPVGGAR